MAPDLTGCTEAELIAASNLATSVDADEGGNFRNSDQLDYWNAVDAELKRRADSRKLGAITITATPSAAGPAAVGTQQFDRVAIGEAILMLATKGQHDVDHWVRQRWGTCGECYAQHGTKCQTTGAVGPVREREAHPSRLNAAPTAVRLVIAP
mgnify:FL=1